MVKYYPPKNGTQRSRRFWYRWGNPCDRYVRRARIEDSSEKKKYSRVSVRGLLHSVNVDMTDEEIDNILTKCFNSEVCHIKKWCYF